MDENRAHRLYMDMRRQGQNAAVHKSGLGFQSNGGFPPPGQRQNLPAGFPVPPHAPAFARPGPFSPPLNLPQFQGPGSQAGGLPERLPPPPPRPPRGLPAAPPQPANAAWQQPGAGGAPRVLPAQQFQLSGQALAATQSRPPASAAPVLLQPPVPLHPAQRPAAGLPPLTPVAGAPPGGPLATVEAEATNGSLPTTSPAEKSTIDVELKSKDEVAKVGEDSADKPDSKEKPADLGEDDEEAEEKAKKIKKAWAIHKTEEGQEYYFNSLTNESSWSKPDGFLGEFVEARPTCQLRVPKTDWFEIHCEDGRKYFFNDRTQETSWAEPEDVVALKQRVKEAKASSLMPPVMNPLPKAKQVAAIRKDISRQKRGREIEAIIPGVTQPPLPVEVPPPMPPAKSDHLLHTEFFELLSEKGVSPFSLWERELPKLVGDRRYQAIPNMKDRRALFEEFCKKNPAERKRQKLDPIAKASVENGNSLNTGLACAAFKILLTEASDGGKADDDAAVPSVSSNTSYTDLEEKLGKDSRWQACKEEDRRKLVSEYLEDLRKSEEKERGKREADSQNDIKKVIADFRSLLVSKKIHGHSRWSKSKEALAKEDRYQALPRDLREDTFRDFVAEQKRIEDARERERQERERKDKAMQERVKRDAEEAENRQRKAAHADAVANYMTLLNEMVKEVNARWSEWKPKLHRDPQGRANNKALSSDTAEKKFREHVFELEKKAHSAFVGILDQFLRPLLPKEKETELPQELKSFAKADKLWLDDTRAVRVGSRSREELYRRYVKEIIMERDDPERFQQISSIMNLTRRGTAASKAVRYPEEGPDKAYERAYLSHDRKRLRKS